MSNPMRQRQDSDPGVAINPAARRLGLALALAAATLATLAGCASQRNDRSGLLEPYRTDLPQGNYVTREMLDQVEIGMTREQVRAALGTPLLRQLFRDDRWDYVFRYQHASGRSDQRRVTVLFRNDRVAEIKSDELPLRDDATDPLLPGARPQAAAGERKP